MYMHSHTRLYHKLLIVLWKPTRWHSPFVTHKPFNHFKKKERKKKSKAKQHQQSDKAKNGATRFANLKLRTSHKIKIVARSSTRHHVFLLLLLFRISSANCFISLDPLTLQDWNDEMVVDWNGREKIANVVYAMFRFHLHDVFFFFPLPIVSFLFSFYFLHQYWMWCKNTWYPSAIHTSCYTLLWFPFFDFEVSCLCIYCCCLLRHLNTSQWHWKRCLWNDIKWNSMRETEREKERNNKQSWHFKI